MLHRTQYSLDVIQEEARQLVCKGIIDRRQPIYVLCQHIPAREWPYIEQELDLHDFSLGDRIIDLLGREDWCDD